MQTSLDSNITRTASRGWRLGLCTATALAAGLLGGCASSGPHPDKLSASAQGAMASGRYETAIELAEKAVLANPRTASYRLVLANAYLRAGRFESARQTYEDAIELGDDTGKAALSLALAEIAAGRNEAALDTLNGYRDAIPAADFGLALALAGQPAQGASLLNEVLRGGESTPKVRQNLAFALALSGEWQDARMMASLDLPADKVDARMQEWAALTRPGDARKRVASLLGTPLREDAGQPVALALANYPDGAQLAREAGAKADSTVRQRAAPELARAAVQELPAIASAPEPTPTLADASTQPGPAQLALIDTPPPAALVQAGAPAAPQFVRAPAPAAVTVAAVPVAAASASPVLYRVGGTKLAIARQPARPLAQPSARSGGTHLVQLGAFSSAEGARRAWRHFVARNPSLTGHRSVTTEVVVNGRKFWRVQAAGFGGFASAGAMCNAVKARGGACLVMASPREGMPQGAPTRLARSR